MGTYNANKTFTNQIILNAYGDIAGTCNVLAYSSNLTIASLTVYTDATGVKGI